MVSSGSPGRARGPLRILIVYSFGCRNPHRRSCAAVLKRTQVVKSGFREILRATLGEAVGLSDPWLELVTICLAKGLLNVAWCVYQTLRGDKVAIALQGKPQARYGMEV